MMKIRELLEKHGEIDSAINTKLEIMEELKCLATKVTSSVFAGSGGNGHSDRVGKTTARIIDLEAQINDDIDRLVEITEEIEAIIASVNNGVHRTLLERRYILGQSWEQIAENLGYSPRHIKRLHGQIIEGLEKIYEAA